MDPISTGGTPNGESPHDKGPGYRVAMGRRWVVGGVVAAALLGPSVTGLTVNHAWLDGRWKASQTSSDLASRLRDVPG